MVPAQVFTLKHNGSDDGEDSQGDNLLNHLQLHQRIGASIANEAHLIGWHLKRILEEGDAP